MPPFALSLASRNDHEGQTIAAYCSLNQIPWRVVAKPSDVPADHVPVGAVDWVSKVLGGEQEPDYYPAFLQSWLHRKVWRADKWPLGHRVFIKPSDRHKRFTGFVTRGTWKGKKKPPFWCAEIVQFVSEWRWYVAAGEVIDAKWGSGEERPVPDLNINWPRDYYAAVDFGLLSTGQIALIESNSAFSCGWYGTMSQGANYAKWLAAGWEDLKRRQPFVRPA